MRYFSSTNLAVLSLCASIFSSITLANENDTQVEKDLAQQVVVSSAKQLLFYPKHNASAIAKSLNHAQVPSQISAQVLSVPVALGSKVKKGQVLVKLDFQKHKIIKYC